MEERNIGQSGLRVSVVGLGCNNFGGRIDLEATRAVVHKAFDLGITLFDTADVYGNRGGSERFLGEILGEMRDQIVLATKFAIPMDDDGRRKGASRSYIFKAALDSLKRLKTDYIDLYQLHRPDPLTPIEETLSALSDLVRRGMVRYVGCSNLPAWQVVEAQLIAKSMGLEAFISCQDEYSLLVRDAERDLIPMARKYGVGLLPYFPLASGLLSGKYRKDQPLPEGARLSANPQNQYFTERNWGIVESLIAFSEARGHTILELALSWLAAQPVVPSVIAGATRPEQLEQNVKGVSWTLSKEELEEIDQITRMSETPAN